MREDAIGGGCTVGTWVGATVGREGGGGEKGERDVKWGREGQEQAGALCTSSAVGRTPVAETAAALGLGGLAPPRAKRLGASGARLMPARAARGGHAGVK